LTDRHAPPAHGVVVPDGAAAPAGAFSDTEIRALYATLIDRSWDDPDLFEVHQRAWNDISRLWHVDVEGNGHGRVIRHTEA